MPVSKRKWVDDSNPQDALAKMKADDNLQKLNIAAQIAKIPPMHTNDNPLWQGPCNSGELGGITQSMLVRFLSCRERFRLKYILGLEPPDKWNKGFGYGNMWHICEEMHAKNGEWDAHLEAYTIEQLRKYPFQREEINKWYNVCRVQFPEYVKYWSEHSDVMDRVPLMQEKVFDIAYKLPSGRVVRLRGKFDSVDLIEGGVYLQENKTKGEIDKERIERQLKFDLQTMLYLVALERYETHDPPKIGLLDRNIKDYPIRGVRYNVIRRPLSGGVGNIRPHSAKSTKTKFTPAETEEEFYERLRREYIADDPGYWFFRVRAEISAQDIMVFRNTCLDPLLEQLCWWYDELGNRHGSYPFPRMNYRTPFGVWSALEEDGATEYDSYMATGSESGLRRVETMFTELQ